MFEAKSFGIDPYSGVFPAHSPNPRSSDEWDGATLDVLTRLAAAEGIDQARELVDEAKDLLGARADSLLPLLDRLMLRAQELDTLRCLAGLDELTGVANRRAFSSALHRDLARCARTGRGVAVLLLDLDGLKALNDRYGHAAGDRAIRLAAEACTRAVRGTDLVARLGGDEFAVLLPEIDPRRTAIVASRVRQQIEACEVNGQFLRVSLGYAVTDGQERTAGHLVDMADQALYQDKRRRRADCRAA